MFVIGVFLMNTSRAAQNAYPVKADVPCSLIMKVVIGLSRPACTINRSTTNSIFAYGKRKSLKIKLLTSASKILKSREEKGRTETKNRRTEHRRNNKRRK